MLAALRKIILSFLLAIICLLGYAQKNKIKTPERNELEQQRINILADIKQTQEQLGNLQKDKNASVQQLSILQNKLNARQALIGNVNKELSLLQNNIQEASGDVQKLSTNLVQLKKQYGELIRFSYKQRISQSLLMFFFSSKNFNDAIRRYQYIKQYKEYRKRQAQEIMYTAEELKSRLGDLSEQKKEKDAILQVQQQQESEISAETNLKNAVVLQIKGKEQELTQQLETKKKVAANLNNAISTAIRREIETARKKAEFERKLRARQAADLAKQQAREASQARAKQAADDRRKLIEQNRNVTALNKNGTKPLAKNGNNNIPNPKTIANNNPAKAPTIKENPLANNNPNPRIISKNSTPKTFDEPTATVTPKPTASNYNNDISNDARMLSASFENNKGYLPNPVSGGYICERFGKVKHPVYNVYTENFGVDIRTTKGATAKSIFAGEVSSVFTLPGTGTNILVNHGNYFTVYSKLDNVTVTKGQLITARQSLGKVRTDEEGNTQVHLEIWKVSPNGSPVKLNPEQWITH